MNILKKVPFWGTFSVASFIEEVARSDGGVF